MVSNVRPEVGVNLQMEKEEIQPRTQTALLDQLFSQLKHKRVSERVKALESLAKIRHPSIFEEAMKALSDRSPSVRAVAVECLAGLGTRDAIAPLVSRLDDPDNEVRMLAVGSLGDLLRGKTPPALLRKLQDSNELVRIETAESIGAIGDKQALTALWKSLDDKSPLVRSYVAGAIGELGNKKDMVKLADRLRKEKSDTSKVGYYQALYKLGKRDVLDELLHMLSHSKDYRVRCAVSKILSDIVQDKKGALFIQTALQKALRLEPTKAAKSSIRSSIRNIAERFQSGDQSPPHDNQ